MCSNICSNISDDASGKLKFSRSALLLGSSVMDLMARTKVIVFGIGGVGSWAVEALVRTGIGNITIVDADCVAPSNINRQAQADIATIGIPKTVAMMQKLQLLNPAANIDAVNMIYTAETADEFDLEQYDYVIDAIDSLADKQLLLERASMAVRPVLFSSMGAALKLDPGKIEVAEFWKVYGCPLAAALRSRIRKSGRPLGKKFLCVFSSERLQNRPEAICALPKDVAMKFGKVATNGSVCHITASFGMRLAGLVISDIYSKA